jgi:hypothetical protein
MVSNSNSSSSSDDDDDDHRFLSRNKGWQGSNMELAHQMESHGKASQHAAVDIRQFQNTQVGKGYQAKHVVRQRQVDDQDTKLVVQDMTLPTTTAATTSSSHGAGSSKEKKRRANQDQDQDVTTTSSRGGGPKSKLQKYLSLPGLILFRGEVEDILNS